MKASKAPTSQKPAKGQPKAIFRKVVFDTESGKIIVDFKFGDHVLHAPLSLRELAAIFSSIPWPIVAEADGGESFSEVLTILKKEEKQ